MTYHLRATDGRLATACGIALDRLQSGESVTEWHKPQPAPTCGACNVSGAMSSGREAENLALHGSQRRYAVLFSDIRLRNFER